VRRTDPDALMVDRGWSASSYGTHLAALCRATFPRNPGQAQASPAADP